MNKATLFLAHSSMCPHPVSKLASNSLPSPPGMSPTSNSLLPHPSMSPARDLMIGGFLLPDSKGKTPAWWSGLTFLTEIDFRFTRTIQSGLIWINNLIRVDPLCQTAVNHQDIKATFARFSRYPLLRAICKIGRQELQFELPILSTPSPGMELVAKFHQQSELL